MCHHAMIGTGFMRAPSRPFRMATCCGLDRFMVRVYEFPVVRPSPGDSFLLRPFYTLKWLNGRVVDLLNGFAFND